MKHYEKLYALIREGGYDETFALLYPRSTAEQCRKRYCDALSAFTDLYGSRPAVLVTAPGRTEVGGNHTDHQRGMVLAAAVDLDILCVASPNEGGVIRIQSAGYPRDEIGLDDLSPQAEEKERAASLIRGIAAWFSRHGYRIGGFDAYTTSDVLSGSGLSSSAAFEVAVGNMLRVLYGAGATPVEIALAGQYAENRYFGKPSGLMDQLASSVGGFVEIDLEIPEAPRIRPVSFDLGASGYHLCIVDTKGSHSDLTGDYAAIFDEMKQVAEFFGKQYLREVNPDNFHDNLAEVRAAAGDRAVLRAIHFFSDNALVPKMAQALKDADIQAFLAMSIRSGRSSFTCLQNAFSVADVRHQGIPVALALSEALLEGRGAWRVHGGGFAGTIQAFVPDDLLTQYRERMDAVFGQGACHVLAIRPAGGAEVVPGMKRKV